MTYARRDPPADTANRPSPIRIGDGRFAAVRACRSQRLSRRKHRPLPRSAMPSALLTSLKSVPILIPHCPSCSESARPQESLTALTMLFAAALAFHNCVWRYIFAFGREGVLPAAPVPTASPKPRR
jgi:hypothetical protein